MKLKELLEHTKEDLEKAKLCADDITNAVNKYDIKPILLETIFSLFVNETRKEINKQIEDNNAS